MPDAPPVTLTVELPPDLAAAVEGALASDPEFCARALGYAIARRELFIAMDQAHQEAREAILEQVFREDPTP